MSAPPAMRSHTLRQRGAGSPGARVATLPSLLLGLALAAPAAAQDADGDGVLDPFDNCTLAVNADQTDSDGDGCGNACDGDFDQTGSTGIPDLITMRACQHHPAVGPPDDPDCTKSDHDGDGVVIVNDLAIWRALFRQRIPGPSSVSQDPVACP